MTEPLYIKLAEHRPCLAGFGLAIARGIGGAALLPVLATTVPSQATPVEVPSSVACGSCALTATRTVTVGRPTDSILVINSSRIAVDGRGRFFVGPVSTPGAIAIYDSSGNLVRTVGRKGSGPGEFGEIERLWVGPGDTLFVYDYRPSRLTVFSPSLDIVRTVPVRLHAPYSHILADGRTVVPGRVLSADRIGMPLHLYGPDGKFIRSFGAPNAEVRRRPPVTLTVVGPGQGDRFWVAKPGRYELELWAADGGVPVQTLMRSAAWFPPHEPRIPAFGDDGALLPSLMDMRESHDRLLWVSLVLPDSNWLKSRNRAQFGKHTCPSGSVCPAYVPPVSELERIAEGRLEIIDPQSRRLLVTRGFPGPVMFVQARFGSEALVSALQEDALGHLRFDIWSVSLTRSR